jgi:hypothetical protein
MRFRSIRAFGLSVVAAGVAVSTFVAVATSQTVRETYVPGAAHVSGTNNTTWRTDLELRSVGTIGARVRIDLLRENRDNTAPPSTILELPAGHARRITDVLEELFGFTGSAALRITSLEGEVRANGRTFNTTPDGTFGQYIGGTDLTDIFATGNDATLIQLTASPSNDDGFRTNLGLVNLEGFPISIDIDLYLADLTSLGRVTVDLEPYEYDQIDGIFSRVTSDGVPDGIAITRSTTTAARYLTYASVIDNFTGDPIYIPGLANTAGVRTNTPTRTPTQTPTGDPSATPTPTATPTPSGPIASVTVTTLDEKTYHLIPSSIRFRVGGGTQSSLVLCSFDGTLSQVNNSNFSFIRGPTETVEWMNCCSSTNFGARLEYETVFGAGGPAVARSTCTAGTPFFAIFGTEIDTGLTIEIDGENLDLADWP